MLDEWRVRKELRGENEANIVSMRGGAWRVPDAAYPLVLHNIMHNCESRRLYFSEVASKIRTKLFFDVDLTQEHREGRLRHMVETLVNDYFAGTHRALFKWRDGSHGCHIIFPSVVTTGPHRRELTMLLKRLVPATDVGVSGLRLPGCWGKRADKKPYFPLAVDASIHCVARDVLTPVVGGSRVPSTVHPTPSLQSSVDTQKMERYIRTLDPAWGGLSIVTARDWNASGKTYTVRGPGQTHCRMNGGPHHSNRIYFLEIGTGQVRQKCFKCRGAFVQFDGPGQ